MKINYDYHIGYRAKKTAIAVFFCFIITSLLLHGNPFYAAIATVICIQQTHEKTLTMGIHRFMGTVIGGVIGFIFIEVGNHIPNFYQYIYIIIIPFVLLLSIYICNILNLQASTSICCIVLLNIASNYERGAQDSLLYATNRVIETTIGIIIAVLVNRFFFKNQEKIGENS